MNLTLETRTPAPLKSAGHHNLVRAVPLLEPYVFFVHAEKAAENRTAAGDEALAAVGASHWVPGKVFEQLNGEAFDPGYTVLYTSATEAMADLAAVWEEVLGSPGEPRPKKRLTAADFAGL